MVNPRLVEIWRRTNNIKKLEEYGIEVSLKPIEASKNSDSHIKLNYNVDKNEADNLQKEEPKKRLTKKEKKLLRLQKVKGTNPICFRPTKENSDFLSICTIKKTDVINQALDNYRKEVENNDNTNRN